MSELKELTEQLSASVMAADVTDLPALAGVHEQLLTLLQLAKSSSDAGLNAQALCARAGLAGQILEQIILDEVDDTSAAIRQVAQAINEVQQILAGGSPVPAATENAQTQGIAAAKTEQTHSPAADAPINPDDAPMVQEFIGEASGHIESAEAAILRLEEEGDDPEAISAIFRSFHTIKGVAGFLNLKQIGALAHSAENVLDLARNGKLRMDAPAVDAILESIDLMKAMIASLPEAMAKNAAPASQPRLPSLLSRLEAVASGTAMQPAASVAVSGAQSSDAAPESKSTTHASASDSTVKVATDRLDSLINMVGELVIAQSMVSQDVNSLATQNHRLSRNMGHLGKLTRELQDLSMSMRMVPVQGVFQKMARLVRDLARKAGKEVQFTMVGAETELDRNMVEAISDPLVHMVRNSVDHGIEPPDQREAAGKSHAGKVELRAYHQAGNIVIEIRDDGRGLNRGKILNKAIAAGIVREGQELPDSEVYKLIFHAGLSTADKVTDISGRGVGMDVVKRNVETLRGRIDIDSTEGQGSVFSIRLPLTLAVIDGQIVKVGGHRYIIPITSIEQSVQPRAEQISTVQERGEMCLVRGDLLPLVRLHRLFHVEPRTTDPTQALLVIVQDGQNRACLLVDELLGQQQVVIKSLGEVLGQVPGISGGAILGDGNVSLILDVPGLIQVAAGF